MSAETAVGPAMLRHHVGTGEVLTFTASPDYATASDHHIAETRRLIASAVHLLHPSPRVRVTAPATVEAVITDDPASRTLHIHLLGYNAPEHALLKPGHTEADFWAAYKEMTDKLRPWTIDFHVAQNDGNVHGAGAHDKTGKHCPADDPHGKLDIVKCSGYWLEGAKDRGIKHICWDGCMFPNATLHNPHTWNTILNKMIEVRNAHGWA
jgi:hypothetical protein